TRCSRVHLLDEWLGETQLVQVPHSVTERAYARKDQLCRCSNVIRIRSYEHIVSQPPQRVLQASQVVQFVINDGDHLGLSSEDVVAGFSPRSGADNFNIIQDPNAG